MIARVLEHLDIPVPDDLRLDGPSLTVQADTRSEEWVARFEEHLHALEQPEARVAT